MKFEDLKIGDTFCYYGGVSYFIKVHDRGYRTVVDENYIFPALPKDYVDKGNKDA